MKNLTKHSIKEAILVLILFVVFAVVTIVSKYGFDKFPLGRSIIGSILFGLNLITYEIFVSEKLLRKVKPLLRTLIGTLYIYGSFIFLMMIMGYITEIYKHGKTFSEAISMSLPQMYPDGLWDILINVFFIVLFVAVIIVAHRSLGPKVMRNLLIGKYSNPTTEEKIFMFLDLASSSRIAEKLGHLKYSAFIKDFFASLDEAILETKGTIYQYVGDEVVVVWDKKTGKKNFNSLKFFHLCQIAIQKKAGYFWETYHIIPQFRAGLHFGKVSITEVGTFKKEIAYHGDPVNTTARICLQAKKMNADFLISEDVLNLMPDAGIYFKILPLGQQQLMGKDKQIELYQIENPT